MVTINHLAIIINGKTTICITIISESDIRTGIINQCLKDFDMSGTTLTVNIGTVWLIVAGNHLCTHRFKDFFCNHRSGSICQIQRNRFSVKRFFHQIFQILDILVSSLCVIETATNCLTFCHRNFFAFTIDILLNLFFNLRL